MARINPNSAAPAKAATKAITKATRKSAIWATKRVTRSAARAANAPNKMLRGAAAKAAFKASVELSEKPIGEFVERAAARAGFYPEAEFPADMFEPVSGQEWDALLLRYAADQPVCTRRCKQVANGLHSKIRTKMHMPGTEIALGLYYLDQLAIRRPALVHGYPKSLLFTAAMMLANQNLDDSSYEVSSWQIVSGFPKAAISEAARSVCQGFRYRLHPHPRMIHAYEAKVLRSLKTPAA